MDLNLACLDTDKFPEAEGGLCPHWTPDNYQDNLMGKMIYKDECAFCFNNAKTEGGLDVHLKSLVGYCAAGCSRANAQKRGHNLVLNIKKTPTKSEEISKVTKLAIGKPGGVDAETDKYDTACSVYCYECNVKLDVENPKVKPIVESIMQANSAVESNAVAEWELEIKACEHVLLLNQANTKKIASKSLATCECCDLRSNLWLCLECGYLGCGRKNWDGSGGNGHALEHFKETGHSVNVKLGTITPEGKASIHCYACDDEVLDPLLAQHLGVLGIDVQSQVKTEKSMTEMNLEANLNLTLSKVIEDGKTLIPVFGPLNTGMQNLGNTCYMNSIVQILFSQPDFMKKYAESGQTYLDQCTKFCPPEEFGVQIRKLALGLLSGKYSQKLVAEKIIHDEMTEDEKKKTLETDVYYQDGIRPGIFKHLVGKGHPEFQTGQQQDAREYFQYLLDKIMKAEKQAKAGNPSNIFEYEMEKRLQCVTCGCVKYDRYKDNLLTLIAPVDSKVEKGTEVPLLACLEKFFADGEIDGVNCAVCAKATTYTQRYRFLRFPKVLAVNLQRFVYDDWVPKKLEIELQVPTADDAVIDLQSQYASKTNCQLAEGEQGFPAGAEVEEFEEPELDQNLLNMLQQMGLPELHAKHALYNTGNNDADAAVTWYFSNSESPALNEPLKVKKGGAAKGGGAADNGGVPQELIDQMVMMGLPEKKSKKALKNCDNNLERAIDWAFSHMDEPDDDEDEKQDDGDSVMQAEDLNKQYECDKPGIFELQSFVTHLGASVHAGHYVCHIKKPQDIESQEKKWIYFNDDKVAMTDDPPIGKGYMYFFTKKQ